MNNKCFGYEFFKRGLDSTMRKENAPHVCRQSKTCCCSQVALEPDEHCPLHGGLMEWPPRCEICGQFMKQTKNITHTNDSETPRTDALWNSWKPVEPHAKTVMMLAKDLEMELKYAKEDRDAWRDSAKQYHLSNAGLDKDRSELIDIFRQIERGELNMEEQQIIVSDWLVRHGLLKHSNHELS